MTFAIEYAHYSLLFSDWEMSDHAIMHVQFSSGITIWQCVLKRMVNTCNNYNYNQMSIVPYGRNFRGARSW